MNHSVKRRRQALHQTHHHYYLNISVEAVNLSDWRIESNRNFFARIGVLYCGRAFSQPRPDVVMAVAARRQMAPLCDVQFASHSRLSALIQSHSLPETLVPPVLQFLLEHRATSFLHFGLSLADLSAPIHVSSISCKSSLNVFRLVFVGLPGLRLPLSGCQFMATYTGHNAGLFSDTVALAAKYLRR